MPLKMKKAVSFWLFLLIPTLCLGVLALWFVHREVDRLEASRGAMEKNRLEALENTATVTAANIRLNFEEVREGLMETLRLESVDSLPSLPEENALVAGTWLWDPVRERYIGVAADWDLARPPWTLETDEVREDRRTPEARPSAAPVDELDKVGSEADDYVAAQVATRQQLQVMSRSRREPDVPLTRSAAPPSPRAQTQAEVQLEEASSKSVAPRMEVPAEARERVAPEPGLGVAAPSRLRAVAERSGWNWMEGGEELRYVGWLHPGPGQPVKLLEVSMEVLRDELTALLPATDGVPRWFLRPDDAVDRAGETEPSGGLLTGGVSPGGDLAHWRVGFEASPPDQGYSPVALRWLGSLMVGGIMASIGLGSVVLRRQTEAAEREARRKTSFVANVSHELKTPLAAIQLYAEMLGGSGAEKPGRVERYSKVLQKESARLDRLVSNLLQLTRVENGKACPPSQEELELIPWLEELIDAHRPDLEAEGMEVKVNLDNLPRSVPTDSETLRLIIGNLLENAVKYAAGGGEVEIEGASSPTGWSLRVMDRGPGIPRSFRSCLFERFTRVDDRLESKDGGLGIGLSIARDLAHSMGAELEYEDRRGGGAVFHLRVS